MRENLEVKILPSGKALARRKDGLPLTAADRAAALQKADQLRRKQRRITVEDVLRVFPGSRVVEQPTEEPKPLSCAHCDKDTIPAWRRGGNIIQALDTDGTPYWACHYCGRRTNTKTKTRGQNGNGSAR